MSEAKFYQLRCDHHRFTAGVPQCRRTVIGAAMEVPSRIRRRIAKDGWVRVPVPQTAWQKEHGIKSTAFWDVCPDHAPK